MAVGIGLPCGLADRSMFRSKLTAKEWNVAIWLSKSLNQSLPCDAAQSFQIVGPLARHLGKLREKVGRVVGSSTN
jgi:hypothetical protein